MPAIKTPCGFSKSAGNPSPNSTPHLIRLEKNLQYACSRAAHYLSFDQFTHAMASTQTTSLRMIGRWLHRFWKPVLAGTLIVGGVLWLGIFLGRAVLHWTGPSERWLSDTGYPGFGDQRIAAGHSVYELEPQFPFWSDGAEKRRWIALPQGSQIKITAENRWNFPIGTRLWKDFRLQGRLLETRMLLKVGAGPWEWDMTAYNWMADYSDAEKLVFGRENVQNTNHDIPGAQDCGLCHGKGHQTSPLGLRPWQIPRTGDGLFSLEAVKGYFANPTILDEIIGKLPGTPLEQSVLGYMDSNCGTCHRPDSSSVSSAIPLRLDLSPQTLDDVRHTHLYRTTIGCKPKVPGLNTALYVDPGQPEKSFVYKRMAIRDDGGWQMPPIYTEHVDASGLTIVKTWIESLNPSTSVAACDSS